LRKSARSAGTFQVSRATSPDRRRPARVALENGLARRRAHSERTGEPPRLEGSGGPCSTCNIITAHAPGSRWNALAHWQEVVLQGPRLPLRRVHRGAPLPRAYAGARPGRCVRRWCESAPRHPNRTTRFNMQIGTQMTGRESLRGRSPQLVERSCSVGARPNYLRRERIREKHGADLTSTDLGVAGASPALFAGPSRTTSETSRVSVSAPQRARRECPSLSQSCSRPYTPPVDAASRSHSTLRSAIPPRY
jgi:hypothetical protein